MVLIHFCVLVVGDITSIEPLTQVSFRNTKSDASYLHNIFHMGAKRTRVLTSETLVCSAVDYSDLP